MEEKKSLNENLKLYSSIKEVLQQARQNAYRAVNFAMVSAYWEIGRLITEDELHNQRADYGKFILKNLSEKLSQEFGKGFDESNLRYMRLFYKAFPICDTLRHELSWSHYRRLLSVENETARIWYMNEAADSVWSTRQLDRQISTLNEGKQMFAAKYKLALPSEEELQIVLQKQRDLLEK